MKNKSVFMTIAILIITMNSFAQVTDKDGNTYKTVKIGTQEWMAENLNVTHFRNGDIIPEVEGEAEWEKAGNEGKPAWCYYDRDTINGRIYHKLYNWYAVVDPRGLAPDGSHVPSTLEWTKLTDYLGGENIAGDKMKSTVGWAINSNGTNESGFAALPGGSCGYEGSFSYMNEGGYWWSSSAGSDPDEAWSRYLVDHSHTIYRNGATTKATGISVRCVKD